MKIEFDEFFDIDFIIEFVNFKSKSQFNSSLFTIFE